MRYLTKSRFVLGLDCPTKLFYTKKPEEYADRSNDDDFLKSLADGGHQVGALAQAYHPGGFLIETLDYDESVRQTDELLTRDNVIIYEAAFRFLNLFVRADVLIKDGNNLRLIEVKAKSCRPDERFTAKDGSLLGEWKKYLCDVAYQTYVIQKAKPLFTVRPNLMCADKSKAASVDGLNRRFQIAKDENGNSRVKVSGPIDPASLGTRVLHAFDVSEVISQILSGKAFQSPIPDTILRDSLRSQNGEVASLSTFEATISYFASCYEADRRISPALGTHCKACQFQTLPDGGAGTKSGFRECWRMAAGFSDRDFDRPQILDIWNWRKRTEKIESGTYFQEDLSIEDFPNSHSDENGLSPQGRQWLQCEMSVNNRQEPYVDRAALDSYMRNWRFPLHFIDFETSTAALPYHAGRRPYEQVAFQFSHHLATEAGQICHHGQWLLASPGAFPNFEFVRALKRELGKDEGTIFRYADHENTVLNQIRRQLFDSSETDRDELITFIESITHPTDAAKKLGDGFEAGNRDMVDLRKVVLSAFYHPSMKGSNSIKAVLPAILNCSQYLKQRYERPVYGAEIPSLNFGPFSVVEYDTEGRVRSPYLRLLPVLDGLDRSLVESEFIFGEDEVIKEGGAAATAYGRIQFTDMTEAERDQVRRSLLRYCEIDTLAMVLLWESFMHPN